MQPLEEDKQYASEFTGVEYTAYLRGPSIYDQVAATNRVRNVLRDYLTDQGFSCRTCPPSGLGSAATGAPPFHEVIQWVRENWELLTGAASLIVGWIVIGRVKLQHLKQKMEEQILDPYKPSVVAELRVRTKRTENERQQEAAASLRSVLRHVPDIDERLRIKFRTRRSLFASCITVSLTLTSKSPK